MKTRKILLDVEEENEELNLGLIRLVKAFPEHELFFQLNALNPFKFSRISDVIFHGQYYDSHYSRFQTYLPDSKICLQCISNKPFQTLMQITPPELFPGEEEIKFLLDNFQDVDYLLKTSEPFDDFSLILHPENIMFPIQIFPLSPKEELYQVIQYYD